MSIQPHETIRGLDAAFEDIRRRIDESIRRADQFLADTKPRPRIDDEHDPEVLVGALIDVLTEFEHRLSPGDSDSGRYARFTGLMQRLSAYEQMWNRLALSERDGVGIYSEDQRALKASAARMLRQLRLAATLIVQADQEDARREHSIQGGIPE